MSEKDLRLEKNDCAREIDQNMLEDDMSWSVSKATSVKVGCESEKVGKHCFNLLDYIADLFKVLS